MKCDELKWKWAYGPYLDPPEGQKESAIKAGYVKVVSKQSADEAIAELKAENERIKKCEIWMKQHFYCEEVIACESAKNRRLRRALWLKRADDAKHLVVAYENYDYLDCQEMTIKQESARTWMTCKIRTAEEWVKVWNNVERKCRAKAEEYK